MTVPEIVAYIHAAREHGEKVGLRNMQALCARLGDPQNGLKALHVAGTNGKGSVCAYLDAVLRAAGYRVGMYTSPYLQRYQERIRLDGRPIGEAAFVRAFARVQPQVEALRGEGLRPTAFEIGTALAFVAFAQAGVDVCVIEVGLGGRLDPTNVVTPLVCAIAAIGMDHTQVLGDTPEAIAGEKAGIIKPGVPVVTAPALPGVRAVFARAAAEQGAPWLPLAGDETRALPSDGATGQLCDFALEPWVLPGLRLGLLGAHQLGNAALALAALARLKSAGWAVPDAAVRAGCAGVRWPGRLEHVPGTPQMLLDGAHNAQGALALANYLENLPAGGRRVLLCGLLRDKLDADMPAAMARTAGVAVATGMDDPRALEAPALARALTAHGLAAEAWPDRAAALARARALAGPDGLVVVAGSLHLVGAIRALLQEEGKVHAI
ncbi:MAG: bifunctional folylpolyglutamate synthase/dihydrofolate synthase [Oscillospiraceae bacterium]|jgi:dihydrofolate synthase/folylpolyglutamate synthase|nr:bifunctional folylpolyglutamate synthase/dihydrofolate synthase [Oscillospiraceae bacterium]